jgi:hypothetical protein
MDARLDPAKYAGLSEGDAHVIRNAGGRAKVAFRTTVRPIWMRNDGFLRRHHARGAYFNVHRRAGPMGQHTVAISGSGRRWLRIATPGCLLL